MGQPIGRWASIACAVWIVQAPDCLGQDTTLMPSATQWSADDLGGGDNVSGIACIQLQTFQRCIVAIDENFSALIAKIEGTKIKQEGQITLAPKVSHQELDAEGVALDPETNLVYVIGSHGVKRHCCDPNPSAFRLVRFPVDAKTGLPSFKFQFSDPKEVAKEIEVSRPLEPALRASAQVGKHVGLCLGSKPTKKQTDTGCPVDRKHGANIEGIAIYKKQLYVGFRGPVDARTGYLMRFEPDAVFSSDPVGTTIPLTLGTADGPAVGVRDLAAVKSGLLILTGPEDDDPGRAALLHYDPETASLTRLGALPEISPKAKPEALLVLEDSDERYRVLVLSDGVDNGKPKEFAIKK